MHMSRFKKHLCRLSKQLVKKGNVSGFYQKYQLIFYILCQSWLFPIKFKTLRVFCRVYFLDATFFSFPAFWNWCVLYVGDRFFWSLNFFLQQCVLVTNSTCMACCICSRWCFDVDIKVGPWKTCRKVTFSDDVARN